MDQGTGDRLAAGWAGMIAPGFSRISNEITETTF